MKKLIPLLFLVIISNLVTAQSNYEKFKTLFKKNDTTKIEVLLSDWKKNNPTDPERYTCAMNFYFSQSQHEIVSLDRKQKSKESLEIKDSSGKVVGYMNSNPGYNPNKLSKALDIADTGIAKFPDRLDIRFGKCYLFQQIEDYKNFTKELIATIEYSHVNKNNWLWTENEKQKNGENFLLETVQTYLKELYDTENDNLLPYMIQIGESALKYYNNIKILSTTSVALMLTKNYDKAIEYLKQAEKLNPKDFIVLNNIAEGYRLKGDKENAIKYYKLTEQYGDEQAKKSAKQNMEKLKN